MGVGRNHKHAYLVIGLQVAFLILFFIFVRYDVNADAKFHPRSLNSTHGEGADADPEAHVASYPFFQDVHVMIFIGFGFLMTFLKRYGFGAVGLNFLVASLAIEWAILVNGFFHLHNGRILVSLDSLLGADFVAACVLITFGALIGTTTPTQLIILTVIEIPLFTINEVIGRKFLGAVDMGDSMFVHAFGAYFGLAVSRMLSHPDVNTPKEGSSYRSDLFAMIGYFLGTIFLWLYWPSFNGGAATGDDQHRAIINTYLSLAACCLTAFAMSSLLDKNKKFDMVHIQNSTLAGGVAVGTSADLMTHPWGAVAIGMAAGILSVVGYKYLTPWLNSKMNIHDTCGVNNLHGMPAILAGIIGAFMALVATEDSYGVSLYEIFPYRIPVENTAEFTALVKELPGIEPGVGRTAAGQAIYQLLALVVTLGIALIGGLLTGLLLNLEPFRKLLTPDLYEDEIYWLMEGGESEYPETGTPVIPMTQNSNTERDENN